MRALLDPPPPCRSLQVAPPALGLQPPLTAATTLALLTAESTAIKTSSRLKHIPNAQPPPLQWMHMHPRPLQRMSMLRMLRQRACV